MFRIVAIMMNNVVLDELHCGYSDGNVVAEMSCVVLD